MPFNNAAMTLAAAALKTNCTYGQLHSAAAGSVGTSNTTTAARQPITWGATSGPGSFDVASSITFTGGAANGPVYSLTLWDALSSGNFYGEFILTGDATFTSTGTYVVTSIAQTGATT